MTDTLLRATHVTRRFGAFTAVDDVSMQLRPGEVAGLLGANGAGKTTLIRMLLGLIAVTSGRVEMLGGPPDRERRRRLGYVPQGLGLYGDLTVRENLSFSARAYGTVAPALPAGLTGHADVLVRELPLGAQRQVAFLAALAHSPGVIVLDEPTSGVDVRTRHDVLHLLGDLHDDGLAIVLTTHDLNGIATHLPTLVCLRREIIGIGTPAEVLTARNLERTYDAPMEIIEHAGMPIVIDHYHGRDVVPLRPTGG